MNKLTTVAAIVFMLTSLSLAVLSMNRGSVISDRAPAQKEPVKPLDATSVPLQEQPAAVPQEQTQSQPLQSTEQK